MFRKKDAMNFSPSDLVRYLESPFASWMDRCVLDDESLLAKKDPSDPLLEKLSQKGYQQESKIEDRLRAEGLEVFVIARSDSNSSLSETLSAMKAGKDVISQARLELGAFAGYSDYLVKVQGKSDLGDYHYEIWDSKLARSVKPSFIIQLCAYAEMLEKVQGRMPEYFSVELGTGKRERFRTDDFFEFYLNVKKKFLDFHDSFDASVMPDPADSASWGDWTDLAEKLLKERDHLFQIAGIKKSQIKKLRLAGIDTLQKLVSTSPVDIEGLNKKTLEKLLKQAKIQVETYKSRASNPQIKPVYRLLEAVEGEEHALSKLPPHSPSDIFFDIEGFPLDEGGLEYLWGSTYFKDGKREFKDFWAHNPEEEKLAFKDFIEWAYGAWMKDPSMHIYHYASYEITACKRLMGHYGVCEFEVDQLLRNHVFVDLYKVVKDSIILGESSYSIKKVELLYREGRNTAVGNGADSIVVYQTWRDENEAGRQGRTWRDSEILNQIRDYNIDDCNSTEELTQWLRELQKSANISFSPVATKLVEELPEEISDKLKLRDRLLQRSVEEAEGDAMAAALTEQIAWSLEFHNRENKPVHWKRFERMDTDPLELLEDSSCLAMCERTDTEPFKVGKDRTFTHEFRFDPSQDFKGKKGSFYVWGEKSEDGKDVKVSINMDIDMMKRGLVHIKSNAKFPSVITLIPDEFVNPDPIPQAIEEFAKSYEEPEFVQAKSAILDFLRRRAPRFDGAFEAQRKSKDIVSSQDAKEKLKEIILAVESLDSSYLAIQGPPGAGKTFTAKHVITSLVAKGKRIGISSNSHKAIHNLLESAVHAAREKGVSAHFFANDKTDLDLASIGIKAIENSALAASAIPSCVLGTTAWGFSRDDMVGKLDYLFIDEAGQVSVANLIAMSRCADNIVLMGDQMQLAQPLQGSHPAESGASILDYLLHDSPTISPEMGVFLGTTYRMHSKVNEFISRNIYDGKLHSDPSADLRSILLPEGYSGVLGKENGIVYVPVEHVGNAQSSNEEVERILELVAELCLRDFKDGDKTRKVTLQDFLFVTPYNLQAKKLKQALGDSAKVGTVDLFQGQEAPIVIFSLGSSDATESSRGMEFLFDRNRLNVAVSRAQCLVVVVGSPSLTEVQANSVKQMRSLSLVCALLK